MSINSMQPTQAARLTASFIEIYRSKHAFMRQLIAVMRTNNLTAVNRIRMMLRGINDGLRGKLGMYQERP